jgi:hypothetical protein
MAATVIDRGPWNALVDDDGTDTLGTPWTKTQIKTVELDPIDAALAAVEATRVAGQSLQLLKAGAGITSQATILNIDSVPLSGLTMLDTLLVVWELQATGAATGNVVRLATTTEALGPLTGTLGTVPGGIIMGRAILKPGNTQPTYLVMTSEGLQYNTATRVDYCFAGSVAANWTSSWSLVLQSAGIAAGATLYWGWSVYRLRGQ